jgi:cyclophilin family peptidyl-prolyl cis-trans isomerase
MNNPTSQRKHRLPRAIAPAVAALLLLLPACPVLRADPAPGEVAILSIKMPGDKQLKRIVIAFYGDDAPATVANFETLARHHFYDGVSFHRVFKDLLVQAGDPLSKGKDRSKVGTGGPGYTLAPEIRVHRNHVPGAVAMSRLPDAINPARRSSGSQFYIPLAPMPNLDGQYTVFGHVIEGIDVLHAISQQPADSNDNPIARIVIASIRIAPAGTAFLPDKPWQKPAPAPAPIPAPSPSPAQAPAEAPRN